MTEYIDSATFDHLVGLAALELDAEQAEYLRRELNHQLDAIRELEAIPLPDNLNITAHGVPYPPQTSQSPRIDEPHPWAQPDAILDQAPQIEDGQVVVPDIPHTTLD
jgi:aspartyl-tRNA(Asn)/glutamyl-tRNA(Gln) amidotransferase subunit C